MVQIEIDLSPNTAAVFDDTFWRFCEDELATDSDPEVQITAIALGTMQRRTIMFGDAGHAMKFQRRWWRRLDAMTVWPQIDEHKTAA